MIRAFVDTGARASAQRDAAALCGQLSDEAHVQLVEVRFSGSDIKSFDKTQWCELVKQGYAALPTDADISTNVKLQSIDIAADGKSADVRMEVVEEVGIGGQSLRVSTQQNGTVALLAGQIKYTKLSARTAGGQ